MMLHPTEELDIRWYLGGWYEGEMGLRSNMGAVIDVLICGGGDYAPGSSEPTDQALAAAAREARVRRALARLPLRLAVVLKAMYGPRSWVADGWGTLGAAAVLTRAAVREHTRSRSAKALREWLVLQAKQARAGDAAANQVVMKVTLEAHELLASAARAYRLAVRR